jgi:nitrogen-specific signal transduction histidine kinase
LLVLTCLAMRPIRLNPFNTTRYQAILDSLNDLVVVIDHSYQIAYANKGFNSSKIVIDYNLLDEVFKSACPLQQKSMKYLIQNKSYQIKFSFLPNQEGILLVLAPDQDIIKNAIKIAGHDFKTPLTTLKLQAQLMKKTFSTGNSSVCLNKVQSMLDLTERQTNRLNDLIEDMLKKSGI